MKNKHIELAEKWLADPKSVTREELIANQEAAAAYYAADAAHHIKRYKELMGYES